MNLFEKSQIFVLLPVLLMVGCINTEESKSTFLRGTWSSYTPQGIHSPSLNIHSFMEDGRYTKITLMDPPSEAMTANAHISLTAYQTEGSYLLNENILELKLEEEMTRWHCERDGDKLYLFDLASGGTNVVLLTWVSGGSGVTSQH